MSSERRSSCILPPCEPTSDVGASISRRCKFCAEKIDYINYNSPKLRKLQVAIKGRLPGRA
jgi:hypothetical protein